MATSKVTFTLDQDTISRLREAAEQLSKTKSEVVREAITDFHDRLGRLSERERGRMLRDFDKYVGAIPRRAAADADREIARIRRSRRTGGRGAGRRETA